MNRMEIEFFDILDGWFQKIPDKTAVIDQYGKMSYAQLDEASARVYSWLKAHGCGKEDFIMIHLPRGAEILAAVHGIFKAGAAYVICPPELPPERYQFIYHDCGCRLEINRQTYDEMMSFSPLHGRETAEPHDVLFAVYTSGSTGMPKGAVHEYGNLDQIWKGARCNGEPFTCFEDTYGLISPCNYAVFCISSVYAAANGATFYLAPSEAVRRPDILRECFEENGVTVAYFPPSFLKIVPGFNSQLRKLLLSSELARGIYFDNIQVINAFAVSECCFEVATFLLDRAYDTPPVGKPQFDNRLLLIDDELCFENRYFRGYANHPEETGKCFTNGIYHSGDMGRMLDDGNFIVTGRRDHMLKIAGNKVMPGEIESLMEKILGVRAVVRGFQSYERTYLCAYYTGDAVISRDTIMEKLGAFLPEYMIPTYYVHMDTFPLLPNGKLDLRELPEPDINDYKKAFVPPETESEKLICDVFGSILSLDRVGLHDDFFELGGDSLNAIRAAVAIDRPEITSEKLFELRTPEKIAGFLDSSVSVDSLPLLEEKPVPAEMYTRYMLDYQTDNPGSTRYNIYRLIRIDGDHEGRTPEEIADRLAQVLDRLCNEYLLLHSTFAKADGCWCINPVSSIPQTCEVTRMSQSEFETLKRRLIQPFAPGEAICRFRIIRTEYQLYFYYDFSHAAMDGCAVRLFRDMLGRAYRGLPVERDFYLQCLLEAEQLKHAEKYKQDREYLENRFSNDMWSSLPAPDRHESGPLKELTYEIPADADFDNANMLSAVLRAIASYNHVEDVMATWTYHNRDSKRKSSSMGLFMRDIPAGIHISREDTKADILCRVQEEIADGLAHLSYQWALERDREVTFTVCQGDMFSFNGIDGLSCSSEEISAAGEMPADDPLDLIFAGGSEAKCFTLIYDTGMYNHDSIERLASLILDWFTCT